MSRRDQSATARRSRRTKRFLPYEYASGGIRTSVEVVRLDGRDREELFEPDFFKVEIDEFPNWTSCEIEVVYSFRWERIREVLPEAESRDPPLELVVALRNLDAFERRTLRRESCSEERLQEGVAELQCTLERKNLRGAVEIIPFLVRTEAARDPEPGVAVVRGVRIADGRTLEVVVDRNRRTTDHFLEVTFDNFSERSDLGAWDDTLWSLTHDAENPVLWLNEDHPRVANVLEDDAALHGARARLREVFYDAMTPAIWKQLFFAAVDGLAEDGETTWDWQEAVLQKFLPELYPTHDELAQRAQVLDEVEDPSRIADLLQHLDRIVQTDYEFGSDFTKAVEETLEHR